MAVQTLPVQFKDKGTRLPPKHGWKSSSRHDDDDEIGDIPGEDMPPPFRQLMQTYPQLDGSWTKKKTLRTVLQIFAEKIAFNHTDHVGVCPVGILVVHY